MKEESAIHEDRLEQSLRTAVIQISADGPMCLREAMEYAVFPAGGRVRPRICLQVALAQSGRINSMTMAAAVALELVHAASLVHDDLPCFDDADMRRGKASVHKKYGEDLAVLVGDGFIAGSFEVLARAEDVNTGEEKGRLVALVRELSLAIGASTGLVAGQAWESAGGSVKSVHRAKTGALFEAAAAMGAISVGHDPHSWRIAGEKIGLAYQLADDLLDAVGDSALGGKPVGQDTSLCRPNAVTADGVDRTLKNLSQLVNQADIYVPICKGRAEIILLIQKIALRLCPPQLRSRVSWGTSGVSVPVTSYATAAYVS